MPTKLSHGLNKIHYFASILALWALTPLARADETEEIDCGDADLPDEQKLECLFPSEQELIEESPQGQGSDGSVQTSLPHGDIFTDFLPFFINTLLAAAGSLIFIAFLYAGYLMVFTNDNEENIEKGKKTMIYAVIGAFVAAISYAVIYGIANLDLD